MLSISLKISLKGFPSYLFIHLLDSLKRFKPLTLFNLKEPFSSRKLKHPAGFFTPQYLFTPWLVQTTTNCMWSSGIGFYFLLCQSRNQKEKVTMFLSGLLVTFKRDFLFVPCLKEPQNHVSQITQLLLCCR